MLVTWSEYPSANYWMLIMDMYPEADINDFVKKYTGDSVGVVRSLFGTKLVVACTDGEIREVSINKVKML